MPLTLRADDNADGTGVTATVAGSGGLAVSLYAARLDALWGDGFLPAGSRVGDGPAALALRPGLYLLSATAGAACSPPVAANATAGKPSVATRCGQSAVALLKALNLPGVGGKVLDQIDLDQTEYRYPCCSVTVSGLAEGQEGGTNATDDIVYPLRLTFYDDNPPTRHSAKPTYEAWREAVYRAFRWQRLPGVPESKFVRVTPVNKADFKTGDTGLTSFAMAFQLACVCLEPRGWGA